MARGTTHQVELLRAEVGTALQAGLEEIRNHTDSLRAELTATLAAGLSEHRDEFLEAIAKEQQEASRAHQDNRSLHRQLGNLRNELSTRQNSGRAPLDGGPAEAPRPAVDSPEAVGQSVEVAPEIEGPDEAAHLPGSDAGNSNFAGVNELPDAEPPASEQAAQHATEQASPSVAGEAAESDSEETTVSETTPADDAPTAPHVLAEDQLSQIAAEVAARLADLFRPSGPTEHDTKVDLEGTEAVAPDQAVIDDLPSGRADDVSGLIPEPFVWENHVNTLLKAAAVKTVAISCHPETWDFLAAQAEGGDHFSKPVNDGNEDTILSGPSTIALLNALRETAYSGVGNGNGNGTSIGTWALAVTSYERIAAVINSTRPADEQAGNDRLHQPHIVLDDRSTDNSPPTG
ncbi:hypothetical protein [Kitasatospora sp. NPDC088779]|uniref:hypothetical protein n=1 Tax=Kitasatospora sp. NPDC088779 TaxID=3154964 RepID=UPI0034263209